MIELGHMQSLQLAEKNKNTIYLKDPKDPDYTVPLIKEDYKPSYKKGDWLDVFVYREGKEQMVATTTRPYIQVGQIKNLRVIDKTKIGYFVDIGLDRDVLLPFSETRGSVTVGQTYLMKLYTDKSYRLALTMDIGDDLKTHSNYEKGDMVVGTVYGINKDVGVFVAVDETYQGLIGQSQTAGIYRQGEVISVRVLGQNERGQLKLTSKNLNYSLDEKAEKFLDLLEDKGGQVDLDFRSNPRKIEDLTGLSKTDFHRVLNKLTKEGTVKVARGKTTLI